MMKEWQTVALEMLPEIQSKIMRAETPMELWTEIIFAFDEAYEQPKNDDFIKRIYAYSDWCLSHDVGETAGDHLPTCVVTCFWEHIPTNESARKDMPRWFSWEDIQTNDHFFKYLLTDDEFADLKRVYDDAKSAGPTAA